jgi:hypothetical protein
MVNTGTGQAIPKLCGKWSCRFCGPRNVRRLAARFRREARKYNRFITLTLDGEGSPTRKNLRRMAAGWRKLYYTLKRDYGLTDYTWVHEQGSKHGRLNKHLVVNSQDVAQLKLSRLALRAGLGRVIDIRKIKGKLGMRSYLTKYLVKDATGKIWPRYARRVQHNFGSERKQAKEDRWIFQHKRARAVAAASRARVSIARGDRACARARM